MDIEKVEEYMLNFLQKNLPANLLYHNVNHTKDVLNAAVTLAENEGVNGEELTLLKTAVWFHDSGFSIQNKNNEEIGCAIAKKILPGLNYTPLQIEKVCSLIMATKIPQSCTNLLEQIICDADLDYLGREDFWELSKRLYEEIGKEEEIDDKAWYELQADFLEEHHYFTATANRLRNDTKQKHLQKIKQRIASFK